MGPAVLSAYAFMARFKAHLCLYQDSLFQYYKIQSGFKNRLCHAWFPFLLPALLVWELNILTAY